MEPPVCDACRRIPLSYLALDIDEPIEGWMAFFEKRNVAVMDDPVGRPSVARFVLTQLLDEQREREARMVAEAAERATRETAVVGAGVPALEDGTAYESLLAPEAVSPQEEYGRPRPNFLVEELEAGQRHQVAEQEAARRRKESKSDETR
jgi:hypothetical protein